MKFGLNDLDIQIIIEQLAKFESIQKALIFGSRAKGNYKTGSDVDIAIVGSKIDFSVLSKLNHLLNEETNLPYQFDILIYHLLDNDELKSHIDRVGVEIFVNYRTIF